jgi:hypothetical protein
MLVESMVRKSLGLKRRCVKKVTEEHDLRDLPDVFDLVDLLPH